MKKSFLLNICWCLGVVISALILLPGCTTDEGNAYRNIRTHADNVKVINTHEHQHQPEEFGNYKFRFYHLLAASYLASDVSTAGANAFNWKLIDTLSIDSLWGVYGKALNFTRNTSYYTHFVKGFQKLYGFSDLYFSRENIADLSEKIENNYKDYNSWFNEAFTSTGYDLMFIDQYWKPFNTEIDTRFFALAFNIGNLISDSGNKPEGGTGMRSVYRVAAQEGIKIIHLNDYLGFCDSLFKKNIKYKAVCIKNSQAYSRSLYYEDVPFSEADILFDKPSSQLTVAEKKKIEDFVFHRIIQMAIKYDLPVQIHTGYLAGNGNVLDNGQPVKLNNLFLKYPGAKFILFHGGFPWTGEIASLAKMFPNVYIDLVWLPQISREEAVRALDVMLDCVPYNKFFWGGDCSLIEESAGALIYARDVVSQVLSDRVKRGLLTEDVALDIVDRIFRENAIETFRLKEKGIIPF